MRFECHTCGSGYRIPKARVSAAGGDLKIRCKQCRAIMVVDARMALDDTAKELPTLRRSNPALTDVHAAPHIERPHPAVVTERGSFAPNPGVSRRVTGVRLAGLLSTEKRRWFAALNGEARGPFSQGEMRYLARQGRLRGSTLVWTPGFTSWLRVRAQHDEDARLDWLRDEVVRRKSAERDAQQAAKRANGVNVILLDRPRVRSARARRAPPALPADAQVAPAEEPAPEAFAGAPVAAAPRRGSGRWLLAALAVWFCIGVLYASPELESQYAQSYIADIAAQLFGVWR